MRHGQTYGLINTSQTSRPQRRRFGGHRPAVTARGRTVLTESLRRAAARA
jgi:hypothetical protein